MLQLPPPSLTVKVNGYRRVSSEFILTSADLALDGSLFRDLHFKGPLELKTNHSRKLPAVKTLNNPIKILLINPNISLYCVFSLNIYEYR